MLALPFARMEYNDGRLNVSVNHGGCCLVVSASTDLGGSDLFVGTIPQET